MFFEIFILTPLNWIIHKNYAIFDFHPIIFSETSIRYWKFDGWKNQPQNLIYHQNIYFWILRKVFIWGQCIWKTQYVPTSILDKENKVLERCVTIIHGVFYYWYLHCQTGHVCPQAEVIWCNTHNQCQFWLPLKACCLPSRLHLWPISNLPNGRAESNKTGLGIEKSNRTTCGRLSGHQLSRPVSS